MTENLTSEELAAAAAGMTVPEYQAALAEEQRLLGIGAEEAEAARVAQAEADAAAGVQPSGRPLPPSKIAFVIDGSLVDVLHVDERLAAIFLSNPTMVDVTEIYNTENPIALDSTYDPATGEFTPPTV